MKRHFISHATARNTEVKPFLEMLRVNNSGDKFFFDEWSLQQGDKLTAEIEKAVDECDKFHLFWSSEAECSTWVTLEWKRALAKSDQFGDFKILVYCLDRTPVPPAFADIRHLKFFPTGVANPASKSPRFKKVEPADEAREHLPYYFGTRRSTLVGREKERRILDRFLNASHKLDWIVMIGAGGAGKSRLALELLKDSPAWEGGFLLNLEEVNWESWQPTQDTILVVDYAKTKAADFTRACSVVYSRVIPLDHRVRFLLLDRPSRVKDNAGDILEEAARSFRGTGTDVPALRSTEATEHIFLDRLQAADIWKIIKEALPRELLKAVDRKSVIEALAASDPQRRPLFALFAADALKAGRNVRQWSARALTQWVLDEERDRFWRSADVQEPELNLLTLSTLVGGLSIENLRSAATHSDLLPLPEHVSIAKYEVMSGRKVDDSFPPLEPDILGELFVIDRFRRDDKAGKPLSPRLASLAWRLAPAAMAEFLWRLLFDFGTPALTLEGRRDPEDDAVNDEIDRLKKLPIDDPPKEWLPYAGTVLSELAKKKDLSGYAQERQKIEVFYRAEPQDYFLGALYAKTLMGEVLLNSASHVDPPSPVLKHLDTLLDTFPDNPNIRDAYLKATATMLLRGYSSTDFNAMERLGRVGELVLRFPADGELKRWHEICDLCVRLASVATKDQQQMCVSCGHSVSRAGIEADDDCLLCTLSAIASSSSHALNSIRKTVERHLIDPIQLLGFTFIIGPSNERPYAPGAWVRDIFSSLITSIAGTFEKSDLPGNLPSLMKRLFGLFAMHPSESGLLEAYAVALPNAILKMGPDRSIGEALYMTDLLEAGLGRLPVVDGKPSEYLVAMIGHSRFAIVSAFAGQSPLSVMLMYLERAVQIFRAVSNESKVGSTYAYGLAILHIIERYEELGVGDTSKQLLKQLTILSRLYEKDHDISGPIHRELYAHGIVAMLRRYKRLNETDESAALVKQLDSLLKKYPDEEILGLIRQGVDDSEALAQTDA